jgi:hypothetical protein
MLDAEYADLTTGGVAGKVADEWCRGDVHRMLRGDGVVGRRELCRVLHDLRGWAAWQIDRYYGFQQGEAAARLRDVAAKPSEPLVAVPDRQTRVFTVEHRARLSRVAFDREEHKRILSGR